MIVRIMGEGQYRIDDSDRDNLNELDNVKPTNADAVVKAQPTVKTLAGADQSSTGFTTTYSDQIFFYVPGPGSDEKIRVLGYSSDILDAKVLS